MGTKENKELVRGFWEVAEKGDYDAFGNYITEDSVDHTPMPGQPAGLEGVKYIFKMLRAAFPDFSEEIVDMVAEDDKVVIRSISRGTHQGELMGIPATGKKVQVDEIHIVRIKDG
ncbi:MAG: ester cyclase, partial [Actinobacteria bacterium]